MAWNFNFCAPTEPNDPAINFHRSFQITELLLLMISFAAVHMYYKMADSKRQDGEEISQTSSKNDSQSENSSSNESSSNADQEQNEEVSIAQRIKDNPSENDSYVSFKTKKDMAKLRKDQKTEAGTFMVRNDAHMNAFELENYFPIVFGHHAVCIGISVMYSPYAEQSIAALLYAVSSFALLYANSNRLTRPTNWIWIFMAFLNMFILMSALLEVGQSNWDFVNSKCFAEEYITLY